MSANSPSAAVNELKARLQRAVSCVTTHVLVVSRGGYRPADAPHLMTFPRDSVSLPGPGRIGLSVNHAYRIAGAPGHRGPWQVVTAAYHYALVDGDQREILAYHWHPHIAGTKFPHLHISLGAVGARILTQVGLSSQHNVLRADLASAHLPPGPILLEDVLLMAIRHFGVRPLRDDWTEIL